MKKAALDLVSIKFQMFKAFHLHIFDCLDQVRNRGLLMWVLFQTSGSGKLTPVLVDIVFQAWKAVSETDEIRVKPLPSSVLVQFFQTSLRILLSLPQCSEPHQVLDFTRSLLTVLVEVTQNMKSSPETRLHINPTSVSCLRAIIKPQLENVSEKRFEKSKEVFRLMQKFTAFV